MPRMRLTLAELLDRYTIEMRKDFYGFGNESLLRDVRHEIFGQVTNLVQGDTIAAKQVFAVIDAAAHLGIHNADIAMLEWQARSGKQLSLEEHGIRSQIIRKINDSGRTLAKQTLSKMLEQNVETRHYGYGAELETKDLTLDVQEPVTLK